jgi:hypothetical protein
MTSSRIRWTTGTLADDLRYAPLGDLAHLAKRFHAAARHSAIASPP